MAEVMKKEQLDGIKLTPEESARLNDFIGRSVRRDVKFTILTNKAGISPTVGIQEVYNSTEDTIKTYCGLLNKQSSQHVSTFDPRNTKGTSSYKAPGTMSRIEGSEMVSILQLILRERVYNSEMELRKDNLSSLRAQLEEMATPEEKKAQILQQIKDLEEA